MRKMLLLTGSLLFAISFSTFSQAEENTPAKSASEAEKDAVGGNSGEKGGIYVVGRAFKTTGHTMKDGFVTAGTEMEKGFKAAGRGIKKGGKATGRGFKKAGSSVKDFFTGE